MLLSLIFPREGAALLWFLCPTTPGRWGTLISHQGLTSSLPVESTEHKTSCSVQYMYVPSSCLWLHRSYRKAKATLALNFPPIFYSSLNLTFPGHILPVAPSIWRRALEWEMRWSLSAACLAWLSGWKQTQSKGTPQKTREWVGRPLNTMVWGWVSSSVSPVPSLLVVVSFCDLLAPAGPVLLRHQCWDLSVTCPRLLLVVPASKLDSSEMHPLRSLLIHWNQSVERIQSFTIIVQKFPDQGTHLICIQSTNNPSNWEMRLSVQRLWSVNFVMGYDIILQEICITDKSFIELMNLKTAKRADLKSSHHKKEMCS